MQRTAIPVCLGEDLLADTVEQVISGEHIYPVYQPIVSLQDGEIYGYEALSRISRPDLVLDIEQMFSAADRMNKSWELETLCRRKALRHCTAIAPGKKLFLNVNSNIFYDEEFREGFTKNHLNDYGLDVDNVIFEITERVSVTDSHAFLSSINHYKNQNYGVAIDDVGAGYSGLNLIASVRPSLIKLDMYLIRDIDTDDIKQLLCKAMVDFGNNAGIRVIAEGIETQEELKTLIRLKVDFGQGYFLGYPQKTFAEIAPEKTAFIQAYCAEITRKSTYPAIGNLARPGHIFPPDERAARIYEMMRPNPAITEFTVVENGSPVGFMTRTMLHETFGGQYGYSLHSKKVIRKLLTTPFLSVDESMPVNEVSRLAMRRAPAQLYNPIVVKKEERYFGIVTVKDLLDACTRVEIDAAIHSNPLTGLPGNVLIEKEITGRLFADAPYCITYYDLDNFKAYNDAYGFPNGDKMLGLVADVLRDCAKQDEFIGHIGGDDFIVICDYHAGEAYCEAVIEQFRRRVIMLYNQEDVEQGFIVSKNRNGVTECFPIASLSIAGLSNRTKAYRDVDVFSNDIAQLKKKCKRQAGNYYEVI